MSRNITNGAFEGSQKLGAGNAEPRYTDQVVPIQRNTHITHQFVILLVGGVHQILLEPDDAVCDILEDRRGKEREDKMEQEQITTWGWVSSVFHALRSLSRTALLCSHLRLGDEQCSGRLLGL